ncbi:helix-turn-helix domain-containing protein [Lachnospiraceae bacterium ASD3451]|nr:helix-turn-helix domain-containing protein [Diplocloster agilis]
MSNGLKNRNSFKTISSSLGKDCTTISKEIKKET